MQRFEVCQRCLDLFEQPRYLEIGVNAGETFHRIRAREKVAVDPKFLFDVEQAARDDPSSRFHPIESDRYFREHASGVFDVIFLDGLHTYEQTLRDLMNSLHFVRPDSVIVIDDVVPSGHGAAIPDWDTFLKVRAVLSDPNGAWMGDVYRLVYFIASFMPMWSFGTVGDNHGQLVMWQEPRVARPMSVEATSRVAFTDLLLEHGVFGVAPFESIMERLKASRAARA